MKDIENIIYNLQSKLLQYSIQSLHNSLGVSSLNFSAMRLSEVYNMRWMVQVKVMSVIESKINKK